MLLGLHCVLVPPGNPVNAASDSAALGQALGVGVSIKFQDEVSAAHLVCVCSVAQSCPTLCLFLFSPEKGTLFDLGISF